MNQIYIEVLISGNQQQLEVANALISDSLTIEGVEDTGSQLKFYFKKEAFNEAEFEALISSTGINYSLSIINDRNWNALWEENFQPVAVDDFVYIRADFHPPAAETSLYEIVITPKMSFGTGHHATTYMMLATMRQFDFTNKSVIDFGSGTGILAIMAAKLQAAQVQAIDYDDCCIENSRENFARNNTEHIQLIQADVFPESAKADIILANINRNIIIDNFEYMMAAMNENAVIILSGLLSTDKAEIVSLAEKHSLKIIHELQKNNWICIAFKNE